MKQTTNSQPHEILQQNLRKQLHNDQNRLLIFAGVVLIVLVNLLAGGKELFGNSLWMAGLIASAFSLLAVVTGGLLNAYLRSQIEERAD